MSDGTVHVRVSAQVKAQAAQTLASLGLTVSGAVRLLLTRVAQDGALPFDTPPPTQPNEESREALAELSAGQGRRFNSVADLMADLHADD